MLFTAATAFALPLLSFAQYGAYDTPASSAAAAPAVAPSAVVSAMSAIQTVIVGGGPLAYNPTSLVVPMGGQVTFSFNSKNHSLTQSSYETPCTYAAGGLNSGYAPAVAGGPYPQYTITVTDATKPLYFYCMQGAHCGAGMVFTINPAVHSAADFVAASMNQTSVGTTVVNLSGLGVKAAAAPAILAGATATPVAGAATTGAAVAPASSAAAAAAPSSATGSTAAPATSAKSSSSALLVSGGLAAVALAAVLVI